MLPSSSPRKPSYARPAIALATALALAVCAAAPAVAQPMTDQARKDQARALAERGDGELEAKKFVEAEATFKEAIALVDAPTLHVRLARALVGQRKFVEALRVYRAVATTDLGANPPPPFVDAVDEAKREADALKKRVPVIRVRTVPAKSSGAARVDGNDVRAGEDVEVDPGTHAVTANGAAPASIEIVEGERRDVDLVEDSVPFPWRTTSTPTFILAGIGLFALGLGTGYGIDAIASKKQLDDACGQDGLCPSEFRSLHDDYVTSSIVSTTSIVVGGAAILTGVIVFAIGKPLSASAGSSDASSPSVAVGPTGASVRVPW